MPKLQTTLNTYFVNITVLEGRHYAISSMDSYVHIRVGKYNKYTKVRFHTDCPYYNEYFVFEFRTTLQELLDTNIILTVYRPRNAWRTKKCLGYCTLDVATVYEQPEHQFFRKWAILSSPKADFTGPRGYLKVTISILAKGETPHIPLVKPTEDDVIEGNLLLPDGLTLERQRALYMFRVYKGLDIRKASQKQSNELANSSVHISFAGLAAKSSIQRNTDHPIWNESLTISELFPPLCQRIKIELCQYTHTGMSVIATKYLNLSSIANDKEEGFLPTFGPAFIHLYADNMAAHGDYVGKLLLSLETKILTGLHIGTRTVLYDTIHPVIESELWNYKKVILFVSVLSVTLIEKAYALKPISFELRFGNSISEPNIFKLGDTSDTDGKRKSVTYKSDVKKPNFNNGENFNTTDEYNPETKDDIFWYLMFKTEVPCMFIISTYPDFRRRLYNSNLIENIATRLKTKLDQIEKLFVHEEFLTYSQEINKQLTEMLDTLIAGCRKYLDIMKPFLHKYITQLDKEKTKWCVREIRDIIDTSKHLYDTKIKLKSFRTAQKMLKRLETLIDHPQECWPNVFLWLKSENKYLQHINIPAKYLVYSTIDDERGKYCGVTQHMYFKSEKKTFSENACKLELFIWLGLERHIKECFTSIPKGYRLPKDLPPYELPKYLEITDSHMFQCRVHIYQGRLLTVHDETGLSDLCVKVTVGEQTRISQIKPASLSPVWDQTLVFKRITVYGNREQINKSPPLIVAEIIDVDRCHRLEFIGRCHLIPRIKFKGEPYALPKFPPLLDWYEIKDKGELLACVELLEINRDADDDNKADLFNIIPIPSDIKPKLVMYRMEVFFWGMRDLKKVHQTSINKPMICMECATDKICSETLTNPKLSLNFEQPIKILDMMLPFHEMLAPPLSIQMYDCRSFGRCTYAGSRLAYLQHYLYHPIKKAEWYKRMSGHNYKLSDVRYAEVKQIKFVHHNINTQKIASEFSAGSKTARNKFSLKRFCGWLCRKRNIKVPDNIADARPIDDESIDWWTKYNTSIEDESGELDDFIGDSNFRLKIYLDELEKQEEFEKFTDTLDSISLYKGEISGDEVADFDNLTGVLKCKIKLYRWSTLDDNLYVTPEGDLLKDGYFQKYPNNFEREYLLRIYLVRAIKLRPQDLRNRCDSYAKIKMNDTLILDDKKHYVPKNVNPIYGRCFEFKCSFPNDSRLEISLWDKDILSSDDLIGSTTIDIENRFYNKHRANCGLQYQYVETGCCPWRNNQLPTEILHELCSKYHVKPLIYYDTSILVGCIQFYPPDMKNLKKQQFSHGSPQEVQHRRVIKQSLALYALHNWYKLPIAGFRIVPEHVETRSLFHPASPGLEQGKLQMWIDMFPIGEIPAPQRVKITPRKPLDYELRVIIWNVKDVILSEDDVFIGERKTDIYVKGWVSQPTDAQQTDVHYRSFDGEGNFNWRFVFTFSYLYTENKIIIRKKDTIFDIDETEMKLPCRLKLQVWDNDLFSADDFIGTLTLDLNKIPRGANFPDKCTLQILDHNWPRLNLFKIRRMRGWWPFIAMNKNKNIYELTGKLDAELELVSAEEAEANPVGLGRDDPHALPAPNRPETSFAWFSNPMKTLKFIVWKGMKWRIIRCFVITLVLLFIGVIIYSLPKEFIHGIFQGIGHKFKSR